MKTQEQQKAVREILYYFLEPHIIRDSAHVHHYEHYWSVEKIWLKLKTCVEKFFGNQLEEAAEESDSNLIDRLAIALLRTSLEELIVLTFVSSSLAKVPGLTVKTRDKLYDFKHSLLNIAMRQCELKDKIVYSPQNHNEHLADKDKPFLIISPDPVNQGNIILRFPIQRSLALNSSHQLVLGYAKIYLATFHLPRMHLHKTTAPIVESCELGKITPAKYKRPLKVISFH